MSTRAILRIRQTIQSAVEAESKSNTLGALVHAALPRLHRSVQISASDREAHLKEYVREYIQYAPDNLEALTQISAETDTHDAFYPILETAKQYFLLPPSLIQEQQGLYALLGEAYLVHRLIEEVDDRIKLRFGGSVSPIDMALPNLLVHSILGEEFANELDLAVFFATESLLDIETLRAKPRFVEFMNSTDDKGLRRFSIQDAEANLKNGISLGLVSELYDRVLH